MTTTKANNIDLKKVFKDWAADANRGNTMECTNTENIEAESGKLCMYEGHHIKRYKFVYENDAMKSTALGFFWMDDGRCIECTEPTKDHWTKAQQPDEAPAAE